MLGGGGVAGQPQGARSSLHTVAHVSVTSEGRGQLGVKQPSSCRLLLDMNIPFTSFAM